MDLLCYCLRITTFISNEYKIYFKEKFYIATAQAKDPVIIEITTNSKTVKEASLATKASLMKQKFIPSGGMGESGFNSTRTTGSHADYYTADVMAEQDGSNVKITITFIKSGSGMLKLQKVADEVKQELGGTTNDSGSIQNTHQSSVVQSNTVKAVVPLGDKCAKFKKLKKAGFAMLIGGGAVFLTGIAVYEAAGIYEGQYVAALGAITTAGGITMTIIGNKKAKEYCTSLNLNFHGNSIGLAYNF